MNRWLKASLLAALVGFVMSSLCLINTTPLTMTIFFFIGLPAFLVGIGFYFIAVLLVVRQAFGA